METEVPKTKPNVVKEGAEALRVEEVEFNCTEPNVEFNTLKLANGLVATLKVVKLACDNVKSVKLGSLIVNALRVPEASKAVESLLRVIVAEEATWKVMLAIDRPVRFTVVRVEPTRLNEVESVVKVNPVVPKPVRLMPVREPF